LDVKLRRCYAYKASPELTHFWKFEVDLAFAVSVTAIGPSRETRRHLEHVYANGNSYLNTINKYEYASLRHTTVTEKRKSLDKEKKRRPQTLAVMIASTRPLPVESR